MFLYIYIYIYWRPSKAILDLSKVYLSPLASFRQVFILSMHSNRFIQVLLISRHTRQPCGGIIGFIVLLFMKTQARLSGSLGPLALLHVNEFIKLSELPLSAYNVL